MISKIILRFFIKANKYFVLGVSNFKNKICVSEYFPKTPSEINSAHPFYPSLIPNTLYVKNLHFVRRGVIERKNIAEGHRFNGMGCLKIFWVNGKKANGDIRTCRQTSRVVLTAAFCSKKYRPIFVDEIFLLRFCF